MTRAGYVYILASQQNGTLYIGVSASPARRLAQHRAGSGSRFARRHGATRLVYIERHERIADAIAREKAMKAWKRAWKIALIERVNPGWHDLRRELFDLP